MITIHKYQFKINDLVAIQMPEKAKILSVQIQAYTPTLWALVNTDWPLEQRILKIAATGEELNGLAFFDTHLGTIQMDGYVWHVFE